MEVQRGKECPIIGPDDIAKLTQFAELAGAVPGRTAILDVAAVGMVEQVWRNSPLEDMHASRRGPSDGEMFAESVAVHRVARGALASDTNAALLDFERHVLDRERPWAAGGRTLQAMGYGHLAAFEKHVKTQINTLMSINEANGRDVLLKYLSGFTALYGNRHYGMPSWPAIVSGVRAVIQDPAHPAWFGHGNEVIAAVPAQTPAVDELCEALLDEPDRLPLPVLDWLTQRGVMVAAQSVTSP